MQRANEMWSAGSTDLFSNREITLLIELVEALPVLYAADKKSFKAIVPREKAWKIISDKLNRTVGECEKKWRYLRDKYVKERRRLLDETKTTGNEVKSNWQHFESMEFLTTHLRLPCNNGNSGNGVERYSFPNIEDDDSLKLSGDSPTTSMVSPLHTTNDSATKQETNLQTQTTEWSTNTTTSQTDKQSYPSTQVNSELFHNIGNSLINPTNYPSAVFGRPAAPALAHNPLWAMWANGMHQASQRLNNIRAANNQQLHTPATVSSPQQLDVGQPVNHADEREDEEPRSNKRKRRSESQDINIQLSLKDIQPAERYAEYHFCLSLAQMMEDVPPNRRPELKVRLLQTINEVSGNQPNINTREEHLSV